MGFGSCKENGKMDIFEAIAKRKSSRIFNKKQAIPRDIIVDIVNAGHLAPTARNEQPWEFVVVSRAQDLTVLGQITDTGRFIADGSACIAVVCRDVKYYLEDGCAATENLLLAATGHGLASCWVAGDKKPYAAQVLDMLKVPEGYKLVSLIALGYSTEEGHKAVKKDVGGLLHWDRF